MVRSKRSESLPISQEGEDERSRQGDLPYKVRLAIPNKGRIATPIMDLMERSGLHLNETGERRLLADTLDPHVEILFARPVDIPEYVANGAADLGITGHDMVVERAQTWRNSSISSSDGQNSCLQSWRILLSDRWISLAGAKIATEFPTITRQYFRKQGLTVTVVPVGGACEVTPHLGIADAIVDLTSSGNTLRSEPSQDHRYRPLDKHGTYCKQGGTNPEIREDRRDMPRP